jgi:hypothetical protein
LQKAIPLQKPIPSFWLTGPKTLVPATVLGVSLGTLLHLMSQLVACSLHVNHIRRFSLM